MSKRKRDSYSDAEKRRIVDGYLEENSISKISKAKFAERIRIPVTTLKRCLDRYVSSCKFLDAAV